MGAGPLVESSNHRLLLVNDHWLNDVSEELAKCAECFGSHDQRGGTGVHLLCVTMLVVEKTPFVAGLRSRSK